MFNQNHPRRDTFSTSLGGMTVVSGFASVPVASDDLFRKDRGEQQQATKSEKRSRWSLRRERKPA